MAIVAFIGLGNMGGPMAANLVGNADTVRGYDPDAGARARAEAAGVTTFASPADAAKGAEVVITMLPSGAIVRSTYAELLPAAPPGALFIDCSTISVDDARDLDRLTTTAGFSYVDAPVSGGVKGAAGGTLAFMVGGDEESFARARHVLAPMAGKIIHCGGAGAGQAAKVCNNMILAVQQIAVAEAFVLAEALGLTAQSLYDVVTGATGNCWAVQVNCPVAGPVPTAPSANGFAPGFATALMNKDLGLARDALASTGATAPLGVHAAELYSEFAENHGALDFSAIIDTLR